MWFLPDVNKKPIPDLIYKCQKKHEELMELADKLIEQHPVFARIVADKFDKYPFTLFKPEPITSKSNCGNRIVWHNAIIDFPMSISAMYGI